MTFESLDDLERTLRTRFRTATTVVKVEGRELELLHPANADELLDPADFDRDERLPYWADIWPSSLVLARRVLTMEGRRRRALELGCGLGLVSIAATLADFAVMATDYYDDALDFTRVNAWRSAELALATRHVDWRVLPADLGTFELILAADVLYERRYAELIATALTTCLAPSGIALVADPGRLAAGSFLDECATRGLTLRETARTDYHEGPAPQTITTYAIGWEDGSRAATTSAMS